MNNKEKNYEMLKSEMIKLDLKSMEAELDALNLKKLKLFAYVGERLLPEVCNNPIFEGTVRDILSCEKEIDGKKKEIKESKADLELALKEELLAKEREELLKRAATCPNCGNINEVGTEYCEECGTWLGDIVIK